MLGTRSVVAALALVFLPLGASSQVVVRDDTDGWGWLAVVTDRVAIVQLAYASSQSTQEGRLDAELLETLRGRGVRRVLGPDSFEAGESQVMAECTGTDWLPPGASQIQVALHAEVSYWDHTRLAATEIWEAITIGTAAPDAFSTDVYVQGCARLLTDVLTRLGFDQG
jgi:hypothetical protein